MDIELNNFVTQLPQDEKGYWLRALSLVAEDLDSCSADRFEEKRDKFIAIIKNAIYRLAKEERN